MGLHHMCQGRLGLNKPLDKLDNPRVMLEGAPLFSINRGDGESFLSSICATHK